MLTTAATTTSTETILAQFPLSCTVENFACFAYSTWVRANIRFTKKISLKLLPRLDRLASACLGQYCVSLLPFNLKVEKRKKSHATEIIMYFFPPANQHLAFEAWKVTLFSQYRFYFKKYFQQILTGLEGCHTSL